MNTGFKYGLAFLAGLILSGVAMAGEPVPIEDRDAFEKEYLECFKSGLKDNCFISVFSGHLDQNVKEPEKSLNKANTYYLDVIRISPGSAPGSVYKIHPLNKEMRAGIFDSRSYLIERFNGGLLGFYVVFRKLKGNWYVFAYAMDESEDFVLKLINLPALLDE
jgi:hypothetical protein